MDALHDDLGRAEARPRLRFVTLLLLSVALVGCRQTTAPPPGQPPDTPPPPVVETSPLSPEEQVRGRKPQGAAFRTLAPEVQQYLDVKLRDYSAWSLMECYDVEPHGKDAWVQRVQYRAKSLAGAYEMFETDFVIRDGKVIQAIDR